MSEIAPTGVELARRTRVVSLAWSLDGEVPDPSQVAALGRPELAHRLVQTRHEADVARAAYGAGSPYMSLEMYRVWQSRWLEAATEARAFLAEVSGQ
jgi:hypothetical protein